MHRLSDMHPSSDTHLDTDWPPEYLGNLVRHTTSRDAQGIPILRGGRVQLLAQGAAQWEHDRQRLLRDTQALRNALQKRRFLCVWLLPDHAMSIHIDTYNVQEKVDEGQSVEEELSELGRRLQDLKRTIEQLYLVQRA